MKLLMWHCDTLRSRDVRKSTRPFGIGDRVGAPTTATFTDVLAAFVCVEAGDTAETLSAARGEILRRSEDIKRREIVVVPFAHLSNRLMVRPRGRAQQMIGMLADMLEQDGVRVTTNSFGFHKEFELHYVAKGYPGSVAFRDVTAGQAPVDEVAEASSSMPD